MPLQPHHPRSELEYIARDAGLSRVFSHKSLTFENSQPIQRASRSSSMALAKPMLGDGALMIYTSGTTNKPKGVISTYASVSAQVSCLLEAWKWSSRDRILNVLPLHHVHGLVNILTCSLTAGALCELSDKFDAEQVWEKFAQLTVFMAVPTIYTKLLAHWETQPSDKKEKWASAAHQLRLMVSGSAALPAPISDAWAQVTGHRLLERYGMTEIGMALSNPYEGPRRVGTVGKPLPGVQVRLVEGEIQVQSATVFREYWRKPEATRESLTADGWFRTGDIAETDSEGYYKILGRASQDILKSGGYKISALEIESTLLEHPDLREVAVVGVLDPVWGERVAAVYVGTVSEVALGPWLKERLAAYKVPSLWRCVEQLPRNAMGKVQKPLVRDLFKKL